jgi:hypothetical protein
MQMCCCGCGLILIAPETMTKRLSRKADIEAAVPGSSAVARDQSDDRGSYRRL